MLKWKRLLNPARRKELHGSTESMNTGVGREEIERDYDRIIGWYLRKSQNWLQSELESSSLAVSFRMGPSRIARQIIHQVS